MNRTIQKAFDKIHFLVQYKTFGGFRNAMRNKTGEEIFVYLERERVDSPFEDEKKHPELLTLLATYKPHDHLTPEDIALLCKADLIYIVDREAVSETTLRKVRTNYSPKPSSPYTSPIPPQKYLKFEDWLNLKR